MKTSSTHSNIPPQGHTPSLGTTNSPYPFPQVHLVISLLSSVLSRNHKKDWFVPPRDKPLRGKTVPTPFLHYHNTSTILLPNPSTSSCMATSICKKTKQTKVKPNLKSRYALFEHFVITLHNMSVHHIGTLFTTNCAQKSQTSIPHIQSAQLLSFPIA